MSLDFSEDAARFGMNEGYLDSLGGIDGGCEEGDACVWKTVRRCRWLTRILQGKWEPFSADSGKEASPEFSIPQGFLWFFSRCLDPAYEAGSQEAGLWHQRKNRQAGASMQAFDLFQLIAILIPADSLISKRISI